MVHPRCEGAKDAQPMTSPSRWNPLERSNPLAPFYLSVFLFTMAESALHVLVPPYLSTRLGLGPAAIGFVVAAFGLASLAARFPVGALYSIARSRVFVLAGGGLSAVAFGLVPAVEGVAPFTVLIALDGVGFSIATTTQLALLAALRPRSQPLAGALGWYAGFVGLGHLAAGALSGLAADEAGFAASFVLFACLAGVATLLLVRAIPGTGGPVSGAARTHTGASAGTKEAIASLPPVVWAGALVMVMINFLLSTMTTFHPILALGAGLTLTQIGILASCRSFTSSFVRLGSGPFFSRVSAEGLTLPLVLVGVASVALLPTVAASFALSIPLFLAAGLSRGLLRVTGAAQALEGLDGDERRQGLASALLQGGLDLGRIAGPAVAGAVAQATSISTMFRALPLALLALYLPLAFAGRRSLARRAASGNA
jgi:predicted MFS family arabinose efflux permease